MLALALVVVVSGCTGSTPTPSDDDATRPGPRPTESAGLDSPNIVLITSDDQTLMEMEWLPKTRRLIGDKGVTFTEMLAPHPNCCPSRAQVLTGQYAHNNGVATNSPPNGGFAGFEADTALPLWLQEAGYTTGLIGKYLHGYDGSTGVEPGWDDFRPIVTQPLSRYFGPLQFDNGRFEQFPRTTYYTELVAEQSTDFIEQHAGSEDPFFLWASYIAPHGSCDTSDETNCSGPPPSVDKYADALGDVELPSLGAPSFNEADLDDKPGRIRKAEPVDAAEQQRLFTARLRALASLDDAVASTVRSLEEAGALDDTVILFTSDNGYLFGEHRLTGKVLAYEESVRVPLMMRGPDLPAGAVRRQTVAMIDLAPTFAELSGATAQVDVDGRSLWGHATTDARQGDRAVLVQSGSGNADPGRRWIYRAVRTGRYTYVEWRAGGRELYDRSSDPHQLTNVSRIRSYRPVRDRLESLLERLETCAGEDCHVELTGDAGLG